MRLAPRLAVSLPLSGLFAAAHAMGADLAAAVAAAGAAGAVLAPSQRMAGVCLAAGATAAALLAAALALGTAALLAALPVLGHLGFAWHFGRTLAPGQEALITRYTRADLGEPGPRLAAYTRALTLFWTLVFLGFALMGAAAMAGIGPSPARAAAASIVVSAVLFLAEHGLRLHLFPDLPTHPWRTLRAIWRVDVLADAR